MNKCPNCETEMQPKEYKVSDLKDLAQLSVEQLGRRDAESNKTVILKCPACNYRIVDVKAMVVK